MNQKILYPRKAGRKLIDERVGPGVVKQSTIEKDGPSPDMWRGNVALYTEETLITWARSLLSKQPRSRAAVERQAASPRNPPRTPKRKKPGGSGRASEEPEEGTKELNAGIAEVLADITTTRSGAA